VGVRALGREHEAVVQKLYTLFELAKVHAAKAQIAEVVGIISVLAKSCCTRWLCASSLARGRVRLSLQAYATPGKL